MLKLIGTILKEEYPVEGENYMVCRLACAQAYIDAHKLDSKKTNLAGLVSLRADKKDKGEVLLESLLEGKVV